jgi:hypothetical protein
MADGCDSCSDLRVRLFTLRAEVSATGALIHAELEKPSMPWKKLLPLVERRLESAAASVIGG